MLEFYFPATLLMQYIPAISTAELREFAREDPVRFYLSFLKNTSNDIETTIVLPSSLKERFEEYRQALHGLILGKDLKLFFSKDSPEIPEWNPSDLEFYISDLKKLDEIKRLKLRRYKVIERIIITDMVFRLYYDLYPELKSALKKFRKARNMIKNFTIRQSMKFDAMVKDYVPYGRGYPNMRVIHVHFPEQLPGMKSSCFPFLTMSGVIQLGMLHFYISKRYKEVNDAVSEAKSFEVQGRVVCPNRISEPSDLFLSDCELQYNLHVKQYVSMLEEYAKVVEQIYQEDDPIRHFIVSQLPCTYFELVDLSANSPFEVQEVMHTLKKMVEEGVVVQNGTTLKLAQSDS